MAEIPDTSIYMSNATTPRKTSKSQLNEACDLFFWKLDWVTGGTRQETLKQAPVAVIDLEDLAAKVTALAANPAKLCAADKWLMERAASIPARAAWYRDTYINGNTQEKKDEERLAFLLKAASEFTGFEVAEILAGAETVIPSNIIQHSFR